MPAVRRPLWVILGIYLFGIFMGAIDTGIVTPARTIIQNDLGVSDQTGIWMITVYTLAYAASIPVMGKLADRFGRKPIYLLSIVLFGVGSLFCGLAQDFGSFGMLIAARAVQALGGGGIVPIANAEFGTSMPPERRGLALGLVGGVYGIANIFGSSAGSLILDLVGHHNWQYIFYVNVPIAAAILVAGVVFLPNHTVAGGKKIDVLGNLLLVSAILSLLYGLRGIDFFDVVASATGPDVYPFLLAFLVLLPLFVLAERRAEDPVLNLSYFTDRAILTTLTLSLVTGVILMGTIFIPQFAENAIRMPSGTGGYFVIILGVFAGVGAPMSGRLVDARGPKRVLGLGFALSAVGAASIVWWAIPQPGWFSVSASLALCGLGLGYTVGSALNYMMLEHTDEAEATSALATLSLVRSIGTAVAPAVLVGFLAQAGTSLQPALTALLPTQVSVPTLPYADELQAAFADFADNEQLKDRLDGVEFPDLTMRNAVTIDTGDGSAGLPDDLVELLRTADVTTITQRTQTVAERMFSDKTPAVVADITEGVNRGLAGLAGAQDDLAAKEEQLSRAIAGLDRGIDGMKTAVRGMDSGIAGMSRAIRGMDQGLAGLGKAARGLESGILGTTKAIDGVGQGLTAMSAEAADLRKGIKGLDAAIAGQQGALASAIASSSPPEQVAALQSALDDSLAQRKGMQKGLEALEGQLEKSRTERSSLVAKRASLRGQLKTVHSRAASLQAKRTATSDELQSLRHKRETVLTKLDQAQRSRTELVKARAAIVDARGDLAEIARKLTVLRDAVPAAFESAKADYLAEIETRGPDLERAFQTTLNQGFRDIYLFVLATSLVGLLLLATYPSLRTGRSSGPGAP